SVHWLRRYCRANLASVPSDGCRLRYDVPPTQFDGSEHVYTRCQGIAHGFSCSPYARNLHALPMLPRSRQYDFAKTRPSGGMKRLTLETRLSLSRPACKYRCRSRHQPVVYEVMCNG